jgi:hypothetical protein
MFFFFSFILLAIRIYNSMSKFADVRAVMLFNDVMRPFPKWEVPLSSLLGQLASFFGVFDCAEVLLNVI